VSVSIVGAISEICAFAAVAGGAAASRAKGPLWRRSLALRVSPSVGSLGKRFLALKLSGIDRIAAPAPVVGRVWTSPDGWARKLRQEISEDIGPAEDAL